MIDAFGLGWNLGNALDCYNNDYDSSRPVSDFETIWKNPVTTKAMIQTVKQRGFKTIRIPVTWYQHLDSDGNIDAVFMNRVKEVVDYAYDEGLYVILDTHHENWLEPVAANYEAGSAKLKKVWSQIATVFSNYDGRLIFESINEPVVSDSDLKWNGGTAESRKIINLWNQTFVDTIRSMGGNNASRWLIVPTYGDSVTETVLSDFKLPSDSASKVMVAIHLYTPYSFALADDGESYWNDKYSSSTAEIDNAFSLIEKHLTKKGIPVIIDEFGALHKNNILARERWYKYFVSKACEQDIPCVLWDNGNVNGNATGSKFGFMMRSGCTWWYDSILSTAFDVIAKRSEEVNVLR